MNPQSKRRFPWAIVWATVLLLGVGCLAVLVLWQPSIEVVLPDPNAVDTLSEAGANITGLDALLQDQQIEEQEDAETLREFLAENKNAMASYTVALTQDCVPFVDYEKGLVDAVDEDSINHARAATYLPRVAARLAELEGRPGDAAMHYAELFSLGSKYGENGVLVHVLIGFAFERLSLERLSGLADSLDATTKTEVLRVIDSAPHTTRDYDLIEARESKLQNNQLGTLQAAFIRLMNSKLLKAPREAAEASDAEILALQADVLAKLRE